MPAVTTVATVIGALATGAVFGAVVAVAILRIRVRPPFDAESQARLDEWWTP